MRHTPLHALCGRTHFMPNRRSGISRRMRGPRNRTQRSPGGFFFQAEDGIRDLTVTGVQTCALPIFTYDRVPKGEIELRRASAVYSADRHHLGSVDGIVVDSGDRITQLLLKRGRLWWKRELAIPAEAIAKFETDMVVLGIEKSEVG